MRISASFNNRNYFGTQDVLYPICYSIRIGSRNSTIKSEVVWTEVVAQKDIPLSDTKPSHAISNYSDKNFKNFLSNIDCVGAVTVVIFVSWPVDNNFIFDVGTFSTIPNY